MKLFLGVLLLGFAVAAHAAPRVVGGRDAPAGKYPYQVSLRAFNQHFCGGSILNKRWILTAAHCVAGESINSVTVVAGTNLLYGDGQEQIYTSEYIVWHERYYNNNDRALVNDVALIRVGRDIEFNDRVQPIPIARRDFVEDNYPATLTGWGTLWANGKIPLKLQEITLNVISQRKCIRQSPFFEILQSHICTFTRQNEGACNGDSGGPLVADGVQIGIVSFGQPCAVGYPDVFTRVYNFVDWINHKMSRF